jgi:hypothetical protein
VLAILVLFAISLLSTVLLTQSRASVGNTANLALYSDRLAAAQSGIENGLQQLRGDDTVCSEPSTTPSAIAGASSVTGVGPLSLNDFTVNVTCQTTSGSSAGFRGTAAYITSSAGDALETAGGKAKTIRGTTMVRGGVKIGASAPLTIANGHFRQLSPCAPGTWPTVTPTPLYKASCVTTMPSFTPGPWTPEPGFDATPVPATPATVTATEVDGSPSVCKVFYPGAYTSPPVLDDSGTVINYFASGPYLFDFASGNYANAGWEIKQAVIIGGKPVNEGPTGFVEAPTQFRFPACATKAEATRSSGSGVTFQFAGKSHINFDAGGHMELFTRSPSVGDYRPSILTTPTGGYPSTLSESEDLILPQNGNTPDINVHGEYYAPTSKLSLWATNTVRSEFEAGIVTGKLYLFDTGSSEFLTVSNERVPQSRTIRLVSSASAANGGRTVTSTAVVKIRNDDIARKIEVVSWRSE